jgi:hypothetical protein
MLGVERDHGSVASVLQFKLVVCRNAHQNLRQGRAMMDATGFESQACAN